MRRLPIGLSDADVIFLATLYAANETLFPETILDIPGVGRLIGLTGKLIKANVAAEKAAKLAKIQVAAEESKVAKGEWASIRQTSRANGYLLDATHPQNKKKAIWFEQALGFNKSNWQQLASQTTFDESKAVATKVTQYGQTFEQAVPISGLNGKTIDVTFVFMKDNAGTVRLVTGIPAKP